MTPRDDDALSWAGDDDPTLVSPQDAAGGAAAGGDASVPTSSGPASRTLPTPERGAAVDAPAGESADAAGDAPTAMSSAALVSLGVIGGVYFLYTVGWLVGGLRLNEIAGFIVSPAASVPGVVVAIAAPAIWFVTVFVLTRRRSAWLRFSWLVAGAVLLVPWPFAMIGTGL